MAKQSFLDRAIAALAPSVGLRRAASRVAMSNLSRAYDGAGRGRLTDGWIAGGTSANTEVSAGAEMLRFRMRDLVRNNPHAAKAVQVLVASMVGAGIRPRANSTDEELNKKVDKLWDRWHRVCDADGHTDFHGLTALAVREMIEGGEVIAQRRARRVSDGLPVPLQIELKEADHIDGHRTGTSDFNNRIVSGIEYDGLGRRRGYWLFRDHPGDQFALLGTMNLSSSFVPAENIAHLFERQRVQARGVPWGAPVMRSLRDIDDWHRSELVRKKTEACLVGVVIGADEGEEGIAPSFTDTDGNIVEQFQPGMVAYANGAKDIKFNQPATSGGVYEWNRVHLMAVAAGFRVPYELMTGDLSNVNFSSSRVGLNEFRRMIDMMQWQMIIPMFCDKIWGWFIDAAADAGMIDTRDVPVEWAPPKFESVNPLQDVQADIAEVRAGFATTPQMIAKRGYDPDKVLQEYEAFMKKSDKAGLVFDTDAKKVGKGGQAQTVDPGVGPQ